MITPEFLLTSLIVAASPGTGVVITLASALGQGSRAGLVAAAGCTLGIVPHLVAAVTGLAAVLHASALAFEALKWAGVAYLLWMAWRSLKSSGSVMVDPDRTGRPVPQVIGSAILANLLNPKLSIFFVAFLPQFIAANDPAPAVTAAKLGAVFMAVTFAVFAIYALAAAQARSHVLARPRVLTWMQRAFAAAFAGLAAKLVVTAR